MQVMSVQARATKMTCICSPPCYAHWDELLKPLSVDEFETLVIGEVTEMEQIVADHNLQEFNDLLNNIFDGDLNERFFRGDYSTEEMHEIARRAAGVKT